MNRLRRTSAAYASGVAQNPNATTATHVSESPTTKPMSIMKDAMAEDSSVEEKQTTEPDTTEKSPIPESAESMEGAMGENVNGAIGSGKGRHSKIPFKEIFLKHKKSSERIREKKLRQNRQLRKAMLPKNALMALNELKGVAISDFAIESNALGGFTALVTVNSKQYEGKGLSKMSAKNAACERAWRDYIIAKMKAANSLRQKTGGGGGGQVTADGASGNDAMDTNESDAESQDEELPMLNLASFAIYKLFAEWEREGYPVPGMHPSAVPAGRETTSLAPAVPKEPKKPPIRTDLPTGWESMHPSTLLCIMRPGISYEDMGSSGDKPNVSQCLGVIVDNQKFTGNGRSKKIARRNVAVSVCNTLFETNFTYEE
ncbi:double-stranded RNA-specific editase 1-like isoform X1 [Drosophila elegans]|uniref:double-stranded RNA-specific editase 1-like isoform X1 n=2 Tax=Drosophila elegans TaxID=30023 RepID=UPI0007E5C113|nr:double-stranded RNA-specific editase 1-like isoform X1 [Drosophila elegans]